MKRLPLYTTVSRNVISVFEISAVNLWKKKVVPKKKTREKKKTRAKKKPVVPKNKRRAKKLKSCQTSSSRDREI